LPIVVPVSWDFCVVPMSSAVKVERVERAGAKRPIDDATVVVFTVDVVVGDDEVVVVRDGITTPDLGSVISPIGLITVGPTGVLRGTKMMPKIPAVINTRHAAVHQNNDERPFLVDVTSLNVVEPEAKSLSPMPVDDVAGRVRDRQCQRREPGCSR
jgi:hypothetical protein